MTHDLLEMSVSLVTAHLSQNRMPSDDVPAFIRNIYGTLKDIENPAAASVPAGTPVDTLAGEAGPALPAKAAAKRGRPPKTATASTDSPPATIDALFELSDFAANADRPLSNKVAQLRDNNLEDPAFANLDPWLAARISPKVARKLNIENDIHPTVFDDHIVCLEDGNSVTLLRAYIKNRFGLSPDEYQEKWNLPDDYPMAPPAYIAKKRSIAIKGGLGRSVRAHREQPKLVPSSDAPIDKPKAKRGRPVGSTKAKNAADNAATTSPAPAPVGKRRKLTLFEKGNTPA